MFGRAWLWAAGKSVMSKPGGVEPETIKIGDHLKSNLQVCNSGFEAFLTAVFDYVGKKKKGGRRIVILVIA